MIVDRLPVSNEDRTSVINIMNIRTLNGSTEVRVTMGVIENVEVYVSPSNYHFEL